MRRKPASSHTQIQLYLLLIHLFIVAIRCSTGTYGFNRDQNREETKPNLLGSTNQLPDTDTSFTRSDTSAVGQVLIAHQEAHKAQNDRHYERGGPLHPQEISGRVEGTAGSEVLQGIQRELVVTLAEDASVELDERLIAPVTDSLPALITQELAPELDRLAVKSKAPTTEEDEEDRHNFALAKDGAKVIAANKEAKKPSAILDSDGDTFLKNECKADKWLIIELSQLAKMDTLILTQNELYSSRVKDFVVRGRQSHPRSEGTEYAKTLNSTSWQLLGQYNASNIKGSQAFKVERPAWVKYLLIQLLTHYGTEAVCALNDLCVFGKSATEDLEDRLGISASPEEEIRSLADSAHQDPDPVLPAVESECEISDSSDSAKDPLEEGPEAVLEPATAIEAASQLAKGEVPVLLPEKSSADASVAVTDVPKNSEENAVGEDNTAKSGSTQPSKQQGSEEAASPATPSQQPKADEDRKSEPGPAAEGGAAPENKAVAGEGAAEEALPVNKAGSAANRHGGSLYDMIVQELQAIKLAQKDNARTLAQLKRNVTAVMGGFAFELDLLQSRLSHLAGSKPALLSAAAADVGSAFCGASDGSAASAGGLVGAGLDFREAQCSPERTNVVKPPTELEVLQLEVANLREMVQQSKKQADSLLVALAFSLLGGIGASFALGVEPSKPLLKWLMLLFAFVPVLACAWSLKSS